MQEKLSVRKVYRNAYRYVASHLFAFAFLTIFYFIGSLLPLIISATAFRIISLIYTFLFLFFAAGCYYKQQILLDKDILFRAGIRFLAAVVLFFGSIFISSLALNGTLYIFKMLSFENAVPLFEAMKGSSLWLLCRYTVIFFLFVAFFIVPSFAFVSEITGKNRSLLTTFVKTRGNLFKIALTALGAFVLLAVVMIVLTYVHIVLAGLARAMLLVFISILYFKMYDFFYRPVSGLKKTGQQTEETTDQKKDNDAAPIADNISERKVKSAGKKTERKVEANQHSKKKSNGGK